MKNGSKSNKNSNTKKLHRTAQIIKPEKSKNGEVNNMIMLIGMCIFIAVFYTAVYMSELNSSGNLFGLNANIVIYLFACILSFILYSILSLIAKHMSLPDSFSKSQIIILNLAYFIFVLGVIYYLYQLYGRETSYTSMKELFPRDWSGINHMIYAVTVLIIAVGSLYIVRSNLTASRKIRYVISVALALFCAVLAFAPNIFRNAAWGLYHAHAYTNSIVNAANLNPYDKLNCSIYGHYGILFIPFVKLFGNNLYAIAMTFSLFSFVTFMSAFYIADKLIKNDLYFCITAIALTAIYTTNMSLSMYLQGMPHRFIYPTITIAFLIFITYEKKLSKRDIYIIEIIIGTCSVLFNFESAVRVLLSISAYHIFEEPAV